MKFFGLFLILLIALFSNTLAKKSTIEGQCSTDTVLQNLQSSCHQSCDVLNSDMCTETIRQVENYFQENSQCECNEDCLKVIEFSYTRRLECLEFEEEGDEEEIDLASIEEDQNQVAEEDDEALEDSEDDEDEDEDEESENLDLAEEDQNKKKKKAAKKAKKAKKNKKKNAKKNKKNNKKGKKNKKGRRNGKKGSASGKASGSKKTKKGKSSDSGKKKKKSKSSDSGKKKSKSKSKASDSGKKKKSKGKATDKFEEQDLDEIDEETLEDELDGSKSSGSTLSSVAAIVLPIVAVYFM